MRTGLNTKKDEIRVCYFGTYSRREEYTRNIAIISGLEANGVEVLTCQVDVWPTFDEKMEAVSKSMFHQAWAFSKAYLRLVWKYLAMPDHDFMFVGYIGHIDAFPARLLAWLRRKPLVFDAFYSLYDTVIQDRGLYPPGSLQARLLRFVDRWSCRLSDMVLLDTWAHVDYFCREFGLDRTRFLAVPPGADEKNFFPRPSTPEDGVLDCMSYSSYIPLHGIDVQLDAAAELKNRQDIRFTFVGRGQLYPEMRARTEAAGLENVIFIEDWFTLAELVELIARADVLLGIFGRTDKAARVIPYKAYGALAMGKPLATGDSPAAAELLTSGENCLLSPMGDASALAENIVKLKEDPELRRRIAEAGHELFRKKCTSKAIAAAIIAELVKRWPEKAPEHMRDIGRGLEILKDHKGN